MKASQKRFLTLLAPILAAAVGWAGAQPAQGPSISNEHRLFQRFIEDGAVTENLWLEGQFRFQSFEDSEVFSISPIIAATFAEDFELGGRIGLVIVDPDDGNSESGFSDLDLWGKVRLTTRPTQLSVGILLDLPAGDEDRSLRLGTGELDVGFFAGLRHDFGAVSLVANAGLRVNQDPDVKEKEVLEAIGLTGQSEAEGDPSLQVGGALLFAMTSRLSGVIETTYETERIDGLGTDFRVTIGCDYRTRETAGFRIGVTGGTGDAAPNFEAIGSLYLLF